MKKIASFVLLIVLIVLAWYGVMTFRSSKSTITKDPVVVQAMTIEEKPMPVEIKAVGTLAARSVDITPEMSGIVKKILFQDGQMVAANDSLLQLDDAVYAVKYQSAKAQLEFSDADYKRKQYLAKQGAISQQAIDQAQADLKEKRASAEEASVMVTKMLLKAPFAGVVSKSAVDEGDYITAGQSVVTLTEVRQLRVEYDVPEQYISQVKSGQTVAVMSTTYPGQQFEAKVVYIAPTVNVQNRSISIYAKLNNDDDRLKPGMFVNVSQALGQDTNAIVIPARSLVPVLDGEQVYKIIENKAVPVSVTVGRHIGDNVQIINGLVKGDVIVTDGQLKLRNAVDVIVKS